jgi:uncharacterized protein with PQ loop repeat
MQKTVKQQTETKLFTAQLLTLFSGLALFLVSFIHGSNLTMDNPVKENMILVMLFGSIVTLFSIFSILTNKTK